MALLEEQTELIPALFVIFMLVLAFVVVHELGHYLIALKFGWHPRFVITKREVAVETDDACVETRRSIIMGFAGSAFDLALIVFFVWWKFLSLEIAFCYAVFWGSYGLWEIYNERLEA